MKSTERIPLHATVDPTSRGTMTALRARWRRMPEGKRERIRAAVRQEVRSCAEGQARWRRLPFDEGGAYAADIEPPG